MMCFSEYDQLQLLINDVQTQETADRQLKVLYLIKGTVSLLGLTLGSWMPVEPVRIER